MRQDTTHHDDMRHGYELRPYFARYRYTCDRCGDLRYSGEHLPAGWSQNIHAKHFCTRCRLREPRSEEV